MLYLDDDLLKAAAALSNIGRDLTDPPALGVSIPLVHTDQVSCPYSCLVPACPCTYLRACPSCTHNNACSQLSICIQIT